MNYTSQHQLRINASFEGLQEALQFISDHWCADYTLVIYDPSTCQSIYILPTDAEWKVEILHIIKFLCQTEHSFPEHIEVDNIHRRYIIHMRLYKGKLQPCATYKGVNGKLTMIRKPKQAYNAYYDEASHSRKITTGTVNAQKFYPYFCASILCVPKSQDAELQQTYSEFEQKYRKEFNIPKDKEFKSDTPFGNKRFKHGFNLKNPIAKCLEEYLKLLIEHDVSLFLFYSHKIEFGLRQYCDPLLQRPSSHLAHVNVIQYKQNIYGLTKLLQKYHPSCVFSQWDATNFVPATRTFLQEQYTKNLSIAHKDNENDTIQQLLQWVKQDVNIHTDWDYTPIFAMFKQYADDERMQIRKFDIDKEGNGKTKAAAQSCGFSSAGEMDSKQSIAIRVVDMAAGLFSSLLNALELQTQYCDDNDYKEFQSLPKQWLPRTQAAFDLYQQLYALLFLQHNSWYKVCAGYYNDAFAILASLLKEVHSYDTWEDYNGIRPDEHLRMWEVRNQIELQHHWKVHGLT